MKQIKIDMYCCKCGKNTTVWEAFFKKSSCCGVESVLGEDLYLERQYDWKYPLFNLITKEEERINWGDFSDMEAVK